MSTEKQAQSETDPSTWLQNYGDYLFRYALSRLRGDQDAAEEVVQEALVGALQNRKQFAGRGSEQAWLLGILKLKIIDLYRQRQRNPANTPEDISEMLFDKKGSWRKEIRATIKHSLDSVDRQEFWQTLRYCLQLLPDRQANVFSLRVMDEHTADEVCKELEITSTNFWVILHRARLQLASCMKQRWFQE